MLNAPSVPARIRNTASIMFVIAQPIPLAIALIVLYHIVIIDNFTNKSGVKEHTTGPIANVEQRFTLAIDYEYDG